MLAAVILTVIWLANLEGCGRSQSDNRSSSHREAVEFTTLFENRCSGCHGAEGKTGPAPALNDPLFLAIVPESEMMAVVRDGRANTLMTAFGGSGWDALSDDQISGLVSEIRSRWGTDEQVPDDAPSYLSPDVQGEVAAGEKLFREICASCHGADGRGGSKAGPLRSPDFLSLISDQALRRVVITGRPDLGMPDYRDLGRLRESRQSLTSAEVTDIVALLASWRRSGDLVGKAQTQEGGGSR